MDPVVRVAPEDGKVRVEVELEGACLFSFLLSPEKARLVREQLDGVLQPEDPAL